MVPFLDELFKESPLPPKSCFVFSFYKTASGEEVGKKETDRGGAPGCCDYKNVPPSLTSFRLRGFGGLISIPCACKVSTLLTETWPKPGMCSFYSLAGLVLFCLWGLPEPFP